MKGYMNFERKLSFLFGKTLWSLKLQELKFWSYQNNLGE